MTPAMNDKRYRQRWFLALAVLAILAAPADLIAQVNQSSEANATNASPKLVTKKSTDNTPGNVLPEEEWRRVDMAVNRSLAFLASQQQPDGSFPTLPDAQPAVTSLCVLAFMAHGHTPGTGPYGEKLSRAVKYKPRASTT